MPRQTELPLAWNHLDARIERLNQPPRVKRLLHSIYSLLPRDAAGKVEGSHAMADGFVIETTRGRVMGRMRVGETTYKRALREAIDSRLVESIHTPGKETIMYRLHSEQIIEQSGADESATTVDRWQRLVEDAVGRGSGAEPGARPTRARPAPDPRPTHFRSGASGAVRSASLLPEPEELKLNPASQPAPETRSRDGFHAQGSRLRVDAGQPKANDRLEFDIAPRHMQHATGAAELIDLAIRHGRLGFDDVRDFCGFLGWVKRNSAYGREIRQPLQFVAAALLGRVEWRDREELADLENALKVLSEFEKRAEVRQPCPT